MLTAGLLATLLSVQAQTPATLKAAYKDYFLIGAALNQAQFTGEDAAGAALVKTQFNTISPENVLKWESVHPRVDGYTFEAPDQYVAFGLSNGMFVVGHNLVWHSQTPAWVFKRDDGSPADREFLLQRLHDHISTVVGRYRGKIGGWDVVNEALNEDGTLRQSRWFQIIGEDYLLKAFQFAHEADPQAELYYNDYSLENMPKRKGAIALLKKLQAQGAKIAAVGLQGHYKMDRPTTAQVDETIQAFSQLGLKVMITELDVDVLPAAGQYAAADVTANFQLSAKINPYTNGLPDSVQQELSKRYAGLFEVFVKNRACVERVTFWGVGDGNSWLNYWPVRGRKDYPLLFDRNYQPKPAFSTVLKAAETR